MPAYVEHHYLLLPPLCRIMAPLVVSAEFIGLATVALEMGHLSAPILDQVLSSHCCGLLTFRWQVPTGGINAAKSLVRSSAFSYVSIRKGVPVRIIAHFTRLIVSLAKDAQRPLGSSDVGSKPQTLVERGS